MKFKTKMEESLYERREEMREQIEELTEIIEQKDKEIEELKKKLDYWLRCKECENRKPMEGSDTCESCALQNHVP